jgi:hypothetical protein
MSAELFANLSRERGLVVERQFATWGEGRYSVPVRGSGHDLITVLRRPTAVSGQP